MLNCIPKLVTDKDNRNLTITPSLEEVKEVVFSLSASSAPGPDGITAKFYQTCWDIIAGDLQLMILAFFAGTELPKAFTQHVLL